MRFGLEPWLPSPACSQRGGAETCRGGEEELDVSPAAGTKGWGAARARGCCPRVASSSLDETEHNTRRRAEGRGGPKGEAGRLGKRARPRPGIQKAAPARACVGPPAAAQGSSGFRVPATRKGVVDDPHGGL